jgi:hypothetical protein
MSTCSSTLTPPEKLKRLCADFGFMVLRLAGLSPRYCLAVECDDTQQWFRISPHVNDLNTLDAYCHAYEVDLLHMQLIGDTDEEMAF